MFKRKKKFQITVSAYEYRMILDALMSSREKLMAQGRYTDAVDDTAYTVEGYDTEALAKRLFTEMADYSVLTKYLSDPDIEEININGWDDVALTHLDGHIEKAKEHFFSPAHAVDIVKKLLHH